MVWTVLINAVPTMGKNAQQIVGAVKKQITTYKALLAENVPTARLEGVLLVQVQVCLSSCQ